MKFLLNLGLRRPAYKNFYFRSQYSWTMRLAKAYRALRRRALKKSRKKLKKYNTKRYRGRFIRLNLCEKNNNFFSTLISKRNHVLYTSSSGTVGMRGPHRSTPFGAQQVGRQTVKAIIKCRAYRAFLIYRTPLTRSMLGCIYALGRRPRFRALVDLIPRPHNGIRTRKARRV